MRKGVILVAVLLAVFLMVAAACGETGPTSTPTRAPRITPVTVEASPTPPLTVATPPPEHSPELVAKGREIYLNAPSNVGPQALWCQHCHTIEGISNGLIGPDQTNIGTDAATRKPSMTAEDYIRESIVDPEVFICQVELCTSGLMTNAITEKLTDEQVDALVAFLSTQK